MRAPGGVHVARGELSLARADRWPLREVPLTPDPLSGIVQAYGQLNSALAESAEVCFDLLALRRSQVERRRRRIERADRAGAAGVRGGELWGQVVAAAN